MQVSAMYEYMLFASNTYRQRSLHLSSLPRSSLGPIHDTLQLLCGIHQCLAKLLGIVILGSHTPTDIVVVDRVRDTVAIFHH